MPAARILLIDPDPLAASRLRAILQAEDVEVAAAAPADAACAVAVPAGRAHDLVLVTVWPAATGLELCRALAAGDGRPVLAVVPRSDTEAMAAAYAAGADDTIGSPWVAHEIRSRVTQHLRAARCRGRLDEMAGELQAEVDRGRALAERLAARADGGARRVERADFIGQSAALQDIVETVGRLQQATIPVLITGESGTGKELIAQALHYGGRRAAGPFVPVNCSAVPEDLAESLFFGHVRGAFSGADSDRAGYFELAQGGTLFLDEVSDMHRDLQAKLLRVLEDGRVQPVGARTSRQLDARVIAATNIELEAHLRDGRFREDLYYRLARYPVRLPPLRQRRDDIPLLAGHFLQTFAEELGVQVPDLSAGVVCKLQAYDYPGNVRELRNVMERALIESGGGAVEPEHIFLGFSSATRPPPPPAPAPSPAPAPAPAPAGEASLPVEGMPLDFAAAELILIHRALSWSGCWP